MHKYKYICVSALTYTHGHLRGIRKQNNVQSSDTPYLKGPLGSRRGTSMESRASNRQGPSHHGQMLLSILVFRFAPISPDMGKNRTSGK